MRICHVTSMHDWKDDRIYERACIGLSRLGHDVQLVASPEMSHYVSNQGRVGNESYSRINDVDVHWIKQRRGIKRRIFSSLEATKTAMELKPDIIHFHDPDLLPFMWYAKMRGNAVIYDIHENYSSRFAGRKGWPAFLLRFAKSVFVRIENFFIARFTGNVFVTASLQKLRGSESQRSIVIGNLPYLSLLNEVDLPKEKYEKITIVTSGIISSARNAFQTLQAALELKKRQISVKFLFCGKYPNGFEKSMRGFVKENELESMVSIQGMMPYLENFSRVGKAHLGCVFYEDNENNRIGLPNRAFEYMFSGIPILGDDFLEIRRLIEETQCGVIVKSDNYESLADSILNIVNKPELMTALGLNGRRAVLNTYNFEAALGRLENFYRQIIIDDVEN